VNQKDEFYIHALKFKDFSLKLVFYDFLLVTGSFYLAGAVRQLVTSH